jgi:hypothetical protein
MVPKTKFRMMIRRNCKKTVYVIKFEIPYKSSDLYDVD